MRRKDAVKIIRKAPVPALIAGLGAGWLILRARRKRMENPVKKAIKKSFAAGNPSGAIAAGLAVGIMSGFIWPRRHGSAF